MLKKLIITIVFLTVCLSVLFSVVGFLALKPVNNDSTKQSFEIAPGESLGGILIRLKKDKLIRNHTILKIYARLTKHTDKMRVGEYELSSNLSSQKILEILSSGRSIEYSFNIPEGTNMYEIAETLKKVGISKTKEEALKLFTDSKFIKEQLGMEYRSLEGYLFPSTYKYTKFTSLKEITKKMISTFDQVYKKNVKSNKAILTRHELVTLASIVEKETGAAHERPQISSVFHNRLKKKMKLQTDPTILYGILVNSGKMKKNITRADLKKHTEYNTYTISALPPGPIASPGKEALVAAGNPDKTPYLYFVSKNDGTHYFSKNFSEHNSAVKKYQLNPAARKGKSWRDLKKKK